jgi:inner membrane protein
VDALAHALIGAQAGPWRRGRLIGRRDRALLGAATAMFPDIDFIGFAIDPLRFLADWHQGPTHSLPLLPLWAALFAALYCALVRRRAAFGEAAAVAAFGLATHLLLDVLTAYGTQLLWPLSARRFALGAVFVIDPWFAALAAAALVLAFADRRRTSIAVLALLGLYVAALVVLQQRVLAIARAAQPGAEHIAAIAQPFSPFNWKLIALRGAEHQVAHVNLAGHAPLVPRVFGRWHALAAAYQAPANLEWQARPRWGDDAATAALAQQLWARDDFAPFRRFAAFPALSRIDQQPAQTCLWFSDLRYDLPALPHTFRYGHCSAPGGGWQPHRLRYFSADARVPLLPLLP